MRLRDEVGRLAGSLGFSALACLAAAALEARWVQHGAQGPAPWFSTWAACVGLLAPASLLAGVGAAGASWLLSPRSARVVPNLVESLRRAAAGRPADVAAVALLAPLALVAWATAAGQAGRALLGVDAAPRFVGAASAAAALLLLAVVAVVMLALTPLVRLGLAHASARAPAAVDPVVTLGVGGACAVAFVAWGVLSGSVSGDGGLWGFWGIWGILKRPELDLRPLGLVVGMGAAGVLGPSAVTLRHSFALLALAPFAALWLASRSSSLEPPLVLVERHGTVTKLTLRALRAATDRDRDGASALFGGGDCNDRDPAVSPLADEILDNGIDDDCRDGDLLRSSLPVPSAAPSVRIDDSARAAIPADLCVVLLTVDTLRADLGFSGHARPISPSLDALAARSVVFERAYSLASYTGKSVGPMLIGKYGSETHRNWGHFNKFAADDQMLAERLRAAGLRTVAVHAHRYFGSFGGLDRGFDEVDMSAAPPENAPWDSDKEASGAKLADAVIAKVDALDTLAKDGAKPVRFFLWAHFLDPHADYVEHEGIDFGKRQRDLYDGEVRYVDAQIGRVLDRLARSPFAKRTAVVVTSDHGEAFGEHGMLRHGFELWEELVRVPLVVHVPGVAPARVKARRSLVDLAPTVLDLVGLPLPPRAAEAGDSSDFFSGASLVPELLGAPGADAPRDFFVDMPAGPYNDARRAFVRGDRKLIAAGARIEVFDLAADPGETRNLAGTPEAKELERAYAGAKASLREVVVKPTRR